MLFRPSMAIVSALLVACAHARRSPSDATTTSPPPQPQVTESTEIQARRDAGSLEQMLAGPRARVSGAATRGGGVRVRLMGVPAAFLAGAGTTSRSVGAGEGSGGGAWGAKSATMTSHFYWVGAMPAMVFVGLFMMPFYYGSRARSVPEYLKLRFDEKTRGLNAITFAVMTIFSSGISMYALGLLFELVLGWSFTSSVLLSAAIVLIYTLLGGLTSAIYNEVVQFFLIVLGFAPLAIMAVKRAGGWAGMQQRLPAVVRHCWEY